MHGTTARLAEYLAGVTYESLPPAVTTILKHIVLDTLGTTLAASTLGAGCSELVAVVRRGGGAPDSTLLGFGTKVPAPMAAAEQVGGVSGREFLAALAAGVELAARLALAMSAAHPKNAPHRVLHGQLFGYFGTAASAARVMQLDARCMLSALGLALIQAAGTMQVVVDGDPPAKAIYAAFANHGGMLSAQLSAQGLGAECAAIEGDAGLYGLYFNGQAQMSIVDTELGERYSLLSMAFKPWATSGIVHPFIEAALDLVERYGLAPDDIAGVHIRGV